jgi:dihydrofolate synthase/folylpolyglutamate synthase
MNFNESVAYLYGLGSEVLAMKLGLDNIGRVLAALGHPEKKYLKVQIAGTNGKGSTAMFLEAICLSAGVATGATVSPHLVSVTERIRLGGREIAPDDFASLATRVRKISEELVETGALEAVPTYFEQVTAIALLAFAEAGVELAILETGLGGRFDATTAAGAELVAITPVDYDHEKILGETLAAIAAEKAAIIRPGVKAVIAPQEAEAENVIIERCREVGVVPVRVPAKYEMKIEPRPDRLPLIDVNFATGNDVYHDLALGLAGRHQAVNALTAVSLAETLREFEFPIEKNHIWTGLENARHKGRLELFDGILYDGAHNAAGARALSAYLDEFNDRPLTIVFGAMSDKNLSELAGQLFPKAERLILTRPDNPRSVETADLIEFLPADFPPEKVFQAPTVAAALAKAREITSGHGLILVTGSLYLVGEAQQLLSDQSEIGNK